MNYVLYHNNCRDGFGAAWAAHSALGDLGWKYIPVSYGMDWSMPEDAVIVYVLDFAFKKRVLTEAIHAELLRRDGALFVLDHHETAMDEHKGLFYCQFDMKHSGAVLAWEHFHATAPVPRLLRHVEDRDLWLFEIAGTRQVSAWVETLEATFGAWTVAATELSTEAGFARVVDVGETLLKQQGSYVRQMIQGCALGTVLGSFVPVANAPVLQSEVCAALLEKYPDAPFAAAYYDVYGKNPRRYWGLRSRMGSDVHVGKIALTVPGGGGHPHASGFQTSLSNWYSVEGVAHLAALL